MNKSGTGFGGDVIASGENGGDAIVKWVLVGGAYEGGAEEGGEDVEVLSFRELKFGLTSWLRHVLVSKILSFKSVF